MEFAEVNGEGDILQNQFGSGVLLSGYVYQLEPAREAEIIDAAELATAIAVTFGLLDG